jgi:hypothetical protein
MVERPTIKQMLFNLLTHCENFYFDNQALRGILMTCPDAYTKRTWKADLERFRNDAELRKAVHAKFEPLYEQIAEARDETELLQLLAKIPTTGTIN